MNNNCYNAITFYLFDFRINCALHIASEIFKMDIARIASHLQELNDDCVFAILETLSLDDLCSVALTCRRFNILAHQFFRYKYGQHIVMHERFSVRIFHMFGGYMNSILVKTSVTNGPANMYSPYNYCKNDVVRIFQKVHKYCRNAKSVQTTLSFEGPEDIQNNISREARGQLHRNYAQYVNRLKDAMIEERRNRRNGLRPPERRINAALMPLLDLNDDSVEDIFSHLDFDVLFPFAERYNRLWEIAQNMFEREYGNKFDLARFVDTRKLRLYGERIEFVNIVTTKYLRAEDKRLTARDQSEMLKLVKRYMPNAKVIHVDRMEYKSFCSNIFREVLQTIETLIVNIAFGPMFNDREFTNALDHFGNLKSLTLNMANFDDEKPDTLEMFLCHAYPKLELACIRGNMYYPGAFTEFCRLNPQLKELNAQIASRFVEDFAGVRYLQNLEKLIFCTNRNSFECNDAIYKNLYRGLTEIKTLWFLDVNAAEWCCDSVATIRQLTHLKAPSLGFNCSRRQLNLLWQNMTNLTVCMFPCYRVCDDVIDFIGKCVHLKELYIYDLYECIDEIIYMKMVHLCERQNRKLVLHVYADGENVLVWDDILEDNAHRVEVIRAQWNARGSDDKFLNAFSGHDM